MSYPSFKLEQDLSKNLSSPLPGPVYLAPWTNEPKVSESETPLQRGKDSGQPESLPVLYRPWLTWPVGNRAKTAEGLPPQTRAVYGGEIPAKNQFR